MLKQLEEATRLQKEALKLRIEQEGRLKELYQELESIKSEADRKKAKLKEFLGSKKIIPCF